MSDAIVGIRFARGDPPVFCHTTRHDLARGRRVLVAVAGEVCEGVVTIAPDQIISAPPLDGAPRVVEVVAEEANGTVDATVSEDIVFLPADGSAIGPADLAHALKLAALPLAEPPEERR